MNTAERILFFIPARGGSKGIKKKNIAPLAGRPLISYTVDAAKDCGYEGDIIVSTDSPEIGKIAEACGAWVPFMRPKEVSGDDTKTIDTVISVLNSLKDINREYDVLALLQPTSPLRNSGDVKAALDLFFENGKKPLLSVNKTDFLPQLIRTVDEKGRLAPLLGGVSGTIRRQDAPVYYRVNGAVYINSVNELSKDTSFNDNEIPYIMPGERSIDIDAPHDLTAAEKLINLKPR